MSQVQASMAEMIAIEVVDVHAMVRSLGIDVWIDGGWGVDALLGKQTRPHADLDIVIQEKDLPVLRRLLEERGYGDVERDDTSPWNFVLGDDKGHEVDVHAMVLDSEGNGVYGPRGAVDQAPALSRTGTIHGHTVRCIAAEYLVKFHTGYELHDSDFSDVAALCERFGIEYPKEYAHLKRADEPRYS